MLMPTDTESWSALEKMKPGQKVAVSAKRARSPEQHRMYFAVLNKVFDNQEQFGTQDELRKATLIELGITKPSQRMNGEVFFEARSLAFHNMGQDEFNDVFNRSVGLWCEHFGHDPKQLLEESGMRRPESHTTPKGQNESLPPENLKSRPTALQESANGS